MRLLVVLVASFAMACITADDGSEAGFVDGKGDGPSAAVVTAAKEFATTFDFSAESDTEIGRADAPTTGPSWVRAAFLLHRSWEDNDLGVARQYRWRVAGYRIWAIRTSTDGDDSFIELFDGAGTAFASGVGGFVADPSSDSGFRPTITWDVALGSVRDRIAPRDIAGDIERFWASLGVATASDSASGSRITKPELDTAIEELLAGAPTTDSIDGWEVAAIYRALAERERTWSDGGRSSGDAIASFYRVPFVNIGGITAPSIKTVLGLPTALANTVQLSRVTRPSDVALGMPTMNQLAQRLGVNSASALPATAYELTERLIAAGATPAQAARALDVIGADDSRARILRGGAFTSDTFGRATQLAGTLWFVDSPAASFVAVLRITPDVDELAGWQASALDAIEGLTGTRRPVTLVQLRHRADGEVLDLEYSRPDGGVLSVMLALGGSEPTVGLRAHSPCIDPDLRSNTATLIAEVQGSAVDVLGVAPRGAAYDVAFRLGVGQPQLARVDFGPRTITSLQPSALDNAGLRAIALSAARCHAESLAVEVSPLAHLEVLLRTAWAQPSDLQPIMDSSESAVGFDPATELAQFALSSVWGDNAVFVTFRRDGVVRIEDFN